MKRKNEKDHRARKSQGAADLWRKKKQARNATRPKQQFVTDINGGHWERSA